MAHSVIFRMQMAMNKLSQLSEMSTSVLSAAHSSISSLARKKLVPTFTQAYEGT
jgi:hypothetical protein